MKFYIEIPPFIESLAALSNELLPPLLALTPPIEESIKVTSNTEITTLYKQGTLLFLKEGNLNCKSREKLLFYYDQGELIHFGQLFEQTQGELGKINQALLKDLEVSINSDFAVYLSRYSLDQIYAAMMKSKEAITHWSNYLSMQTQLFAALSAFALKGSRDVQPKVRVFSPGDTIVKEGDVGTSIFTLIEGRADVFVEKVKVGEVQCNEIFGALAALTDLKRSATVKAAEQCLVLVMEREEFNELLEARPTIVGKLVQDLARMVVDLNGTVVASHLSMYR